MKAPSATKNPPSSPPRPRRSVAVWLVPALLAGACFAMVLQKTDLSVADLGRHIKNGELIATAPWPVKQAVLHRNFYSYAQRDFPFINHHWLSGVVFFLAWKGSGFEGLTILYAALISAAVLLFYFAGARGSNPILAGAIAALALPMVGWRVEVRPEAFTYLFTGVFFWALAEWFAGRLKSGMLWLLPGLMLAWVNLHIGFVFGFLVLGMFALKAVQRAAMKSSLAQAWRDPQVRTLLPVAGLCMVAAVLNPSFIRGALYPLSIYHNYGFSVIENQSIFNPPPLAGWQTQYDFFKISLGLAVAVIAIRWLAKARENRFPEILLLVSTGVLAMSGIRHFPMFGLFEVAILPELLEDAMRPKKAIAQAKWPRYAAIAVMAWGLFSCWELYDSRKVTAGIGLKAGVNATADFLRDNRIAGPIFNDFNNGGYLIFHRFPGRPAEAPELDLDRVFVDARAEAYPSSFFDDTYIKMQADEDVWRQQNQKYRFNAIVFSLQYNNNAWTEKFLLARIHDPDWAPVFSDDYNLIFLRRNDRNGEAIKAHELPKSMFR